MNTFQSDHAEYNHEWNIIKQGGYASAVQKLLDYFKLRLINPFIRDARSDCSIAH